MRSLVILFLALSLSEAKAQSQDAASDIVLALRQQREEALDKVANAYVTIMKLQRELDRLKADQGNHAVPPQTPPSK
jgi:hypothetical protein